MEQDFAEFFGKVHIETGATSPREKVTKLEFIRWRTKIFGASGQYNPRPKTTTQPPRVLLSSSLSYSLPSTATPTPSPSSSSSSSSSSTSANISTVGNAKKKRAGKRCSNINCPTRSRYDAVLHRHVWSRMS